MVHGVLCSMGMGGVAARETLEMGRERAAMVGTKATMPMVVVEGGRVVLRVGGVIQSVQVDDTYEADVWDAMVPVERPERVLILGLGGGTVATLLTRRFGAVEIVGVERDPAVIHLARRELGMDALPHVRIVRDDAFDFVRREAAEHAGAYNLVTVDLYTAGKMAHGVLEPGFLRGVAQLLAPEGVATFNLWRSAHLADQVRRVARVLPVLRSVEVDENVVLHCGRAAIQTAR